MCTNILSPSGCAFPHEDWENALCTIQVFFHESVLLERTLRGQNVCFLNCKQIPQQGWAFFCSIVFFGCFNKISTYSNLSLEYRNIETQNCASIQVILILSFLPSILNNRVNQVAHLIILWPQIFFLWVSAELKLVQWNLSFLFFSRLSVTSGACS